MNLHLSNDEPSYEYWTSQAHQQDRCAKNAIQVKEGIWTADQAARFNLAKQLEKELRENSPALGNSVYGDLLSAALDRVDWVEIAKDWLTKE